MTEWRPVAGYERLYEVSDGGVVRSVERLIEYADGRKHRHAGATLKPATNPVTGYAHVSLSRGRRQRSFNVHVLVATAFIGARPDGKDVCHFDGNRQNNAASNLRYDTRSANHLDKRVHGTSPQGERCGGAKLTEAQVRQIRFQISQGATLKAMAGRFGVSVTAVQNIRCGITWAHLGPVSRPNQADEPVPAILEAPTG